MRPSRLTATLSLAVVGAVLAVASPPAAGADQRELVSSAAAPGCPEGRIPRDDRCVGSSRAARRVVAIARRVKRENDLNAVILRVEIGGRPLVTAALGRSMTGVPAARRMHFRIGSVAIAYLTTLLLQLQDEGRLSLDDRLAEWFPRFPNANRITLEMLANNTSGYPDYIQGNPIFVEDLHADVFRQWSPNELLDYAFQRPLACEPGACFNYAHTNYVILSKVLTEVTGKPVRQLMRRRILRPLGLRDTNIKPTPRIPPPVLHSYTSDRGPYEDSTFWSPSWTVGRGTIMTGDIRDVARSAAAIGTGELISQKAHRQQVGPSTVGIGANTRRLYFGLGLLVANRWRLQNPFVNGWASIMAFLPSDRISVAVTSTQGEDSPDAHHSATIFERIGAYLAPQRPPPPLP